MPTDALALYAVVILVFPMVCFFLSSPTFLLVGLHVPEVSKLLRGIVHGYFLVIGIAGVISMVLFTVAGRQAFAIGAIAAAAFAIAVRRWLLRRIDRELAANEAGISTAARRLRVLHIKSMLINAAQLATVVVCVPLVI